MGIERSFEPWNRAKLLSVVLPALDGVVERLTEGITVADVGCGAGGALLLMAGAYPNSRFRGYDISRYALRRAEEKLQEASGETSRSAIRVTYRCPTMRRSGSSRRSIASTT